jgi:hypothetical protein
MSRCTHPHDLLFQHQPYVHPHLIAPMPNGPFSLKTFWTTTTTGNDRVMATITIMTTKPSNVYYKVADPFPITTHFRRLDQPIFVQHNNKIC